MGLIQAAAGANQAGILPGGYPWPTGFKDGVYVVGGQCYNLEYFLLISSALSIFTDLLMLFIPIYMVYDLQLTAKKKTVVLLVLCMGLGYVVYTQAFAAVVQKAYFSQVSRQSVQYDSKSSTADTIRNRVRI